MEDILTYKELLDCKINNGFLYKKIDVKKILKSEKIGDITLGELLSESLFQNCDINQLENVIIENSKFDFVQINKLKNAEFKNCHFDTKVLDGNSSENVSYTNCRFRFCNLDYSKSSIKNIKFINVEQDCCVIEANENIKVENIEEDEKNNHLTLQQNKILFYQKHKESILKALNLTETPNVINGVLLRAYVLGIKDFSLMFQEGEIKTADIKTIPIRKKLFLNGEEQVFNNETIQQLLQNKKLFVKITDKFEIEIYDHINTIHFLDFSKYATRLRNIDIKDSGLLDFIDKSEDELKAEHYSRLEDYILRFKEINKIFNDPLYELQNSLVRILFPNMEFVIIQPRSDFNISYIENSSIYNYMLTGHSVAINNIEGLDNESIKKMYVNERGMKFNFFLIENINPNVNLNNLDKKVIVLKDVVDGDPCNAIYNNQKDDLSSDIRQLTTVKDNLLQQYSEALSDITRKKILLRALSFNEDDSSKLIQKVREIPEIKYAFFMDDKIILKTRDIEYESEEGITFLMGRFTIVIDLLHKDIKITNVFTTYGYECDMQHPHIFHTGVPCYGDLELSVTEMLSQGHIYPLIITLINFLGEVNQEDTAGKMVFKWPIILGKSKKNNVVHVAIMDNEINARDNEDEYGFDDLLDSIESFKNDLYVDEIDADSDFEETHRYNIFDTSTAFYEALNVDIPNDYIEDILEVFRNPKHYIKIEEE